MRSRTKSLWAEWGQPAWHEPFQAFVATLASARVVLAWIAYSWLIFHGNTSTAESQFHISTGQTLVYGLAGAFFFFRSSEDSRVRPLGLVFLLIANAYVNYPLFSLYLAIRPNFDSFTALALGIIPEVFLPLFFWVFVERFPSSTKSLALRRVIVLGRRIALLLGGLVFLIGVARVYRRIAGIVVSESVERLFGLFDAKWYVLYPLLVVLLPVTFLKFRQLKGEERRRSWLFFYSFTVFWALPCFSDYFGDILPTALQWGGRKLLGEMQPHILNFLTFMFPLAATYAVLADRVLDVRTLAQNAFRHMLAKYSVLLIGLLPFLFLVYFGVSSRELTLAEFFSGSHAVVLLTVAALAGVGFAYRRQMLNFIDRRFFRAQFDSRQVLTELIGQVRGARGLTELAQLLERGVDQALHLERVSLLVEKRSAGRYIDPLGRLRPLDPGSPLLTIVAGSREPISVDLESPRSPFRSLPEEDKLWLAENKVETLAAICSLDGHLLGLLALGRKRSELPFLHEDRDLLAAVATSAGLVIELLQLRETATNIPSAGFVAPAEESEEIPSPDELATTCIACDRLYPPGSTDCPHCSVGLEKTNVPYILRELYRLDFRLGAGGMAVVYRAKDLKLGRPVAVKTLPRVNAEAAMRLRREARTAASVSHPGLAAIYGLENWRGVPMIITELLAGGTLADQLGRDPLEAIDAIDMAHTIALALAKIHGIGILHRDVKPSNIGYTEDGHVKLLDFGIARIEHDFRREHPDGGQTSGAHRIFGSTTSVMLPRTRTGQLVGTVTYLSPEAARGEKPDPGVDLWALAVCVHESLTAENLFYGRNFDEVLDKIRNSEVPDVRKKAPTCPEPLARFLAAELSLDRSRRAEDGLEMASRLAEVRARILGA